MYSSAATSTRPLAYSGTISLRVPSSPTSLLSDASSLASYSSDLLQSPGASSIAVSKMTTSAFFWQSFLLPSASDIARNDDDAATSQDIESTSLYSRSGATSFAAYPSASPKRGSVYTGDITYYDVGLGSCGWISTPDQTVVAIPHGMMNNGINSNNNPLCGTTITISYNGRTHHAKIVDTCGGCEGASIDLSNSLFAAVAPEGDGRVHGVSWWYD